jgi:hypothetical protein
MPVTQIGGYENRFLWQNDENNNPSVHAVVLNAFSGLIGMY